MPAKKTATKRKTAKRSKTAKRVSKVSAQTKRYGRVHRVRVKVNKTGNAFDIHLSRDPTIKR